jgi:hypothetical protein
MKTISKWMTALAVIAAGASLTTTGPAFAAKEKKADNLIATSDKPLDCVQLTRIRNTNVRDDRTIDFIMINGDVYRNSLANSCPQLGFERRFSYQTSLSQLCSVDIITVLTAGGPNNLMRGASCGLGKFQKMEKAGK